MRKQKIRSVIMAVSWRIEGDVHIVADSRLTDALNSKANEFLALTDAIVYDAETGKELYREDYLSVNKAAIVFAFPAP